MPEWALPIDPALQRLLIEALAAERNSDWLLAASHYQAALQLQPDDHRLECNAANALWLADRPEEAMAGFRRAVELAPQEPLPWRGLGNAARDNNRFGSAARAYRRSATQRNDPLTDWNLSQVLLGLGRYREAFRKAERRLFVAGLEPFYQGPGWDGRTASMQRAQAEGIPLHVWSEQGFGDTLQFLRWLKPLTANLPQGGPGVVLLVEPPLVPLLEQGLGWLEAKLEVRAKDDAQGLRRDWDQHHVSLQSLPHRLNQGHWVHPRQCGTGPWLRLGPRASHEHPQGPSGPPRVGILWAAGRKLTDGFTRREYQKRSLSPDGLGRLVEGLTASGAEVVALQHGPDRDQIAPWRHHLAGELAADADFLATALLLDQLDLVITVDTAMAHLAGCLGRPAWVLLPWSADPRWLRQRSDSPWYPSLRLFRQPRSGDWHTAISTVLKAFRTPT
jgi:hypothetical protein